jgi:hypothetical protein
LLSSGTRKRVPTSSHRAYPRHTLRFAGQSITIAPHVHPQRCWPCELCLLMPPFPSVLPLCLTAFPRSCLWCLRSSSGRFFSRSCQFFRPPAARLSLASSFACGGPRRAIIGQLFLGGVFLLHDSSRPARRTAKAWRLRPARGTAPRVSGSRQSVLHEQQGTAAAAVTIAVAAATGRRVQHIA